MSEFAESKDPQIFMSRHLNMMYGLPITVRLKVHREYFTLIHDYFGDNYELRLTRRRSLSIFRDYKLLLLGDYIHCGNEYISRMEDLPYYYVEGNAIFFMRG